MHYRAQMEASGLNRILERCRGFQFAGLDKQLEQYDELYEEDHQQLLQNFDQEILRDMSDPYDVYRAIMQSVEGTDAFKYFLSAMQHLLLVRVDDETKRSYFQLIDSLVTSVVLDKKPSFNDGISNTVGLSVERLVAQFGEQERAQALEKEATDARIQLGHLKLEKQALEEELASVSDGLVGQLKKRLAAAEEKLQISRATTDALKEQLADQKRLYEEQTSQLELQISELFKMLKESRGFASAVEANRGMDRKDLISNLSRQMEHKKTIGILEGRRGGPLDEDMDEEEEEEREPGFVGADMDAEALKRRRRTAENRRKAQAGLTAGGEPSTGRASQFMDAEEERVRLHIEESLAAGAELMVCYLSLTTHPFAENYCPVSAFGRIFPSTKCTCSQ
jgi:cytokinesis protein